MTPEILVLALTIPLGFVYLFAAIIAATKQRGVEWNRGNRDGNPPPLTGAAFRLEQAFQNFRETFPLFAAAVLALAFLHRGNMLSVIGAHLYFWGRLIYLPIYGRGITGARTAVWLLSVLGIVLVWICVWL